MGMEGVRETQFAREIYAITQPHVEASGVDDTDLDMFIWDSPFNFLLEQALVSLEDPNALAKVTQLCTLVTHIPVYSELAIML